MFTQVFQIKYCSLEDVLHEQFGFIIRFIIKNYIIKLHFCKNLYDIHGIVFILFYYVTDLGISMILDLQYVIKA